MIWGKLEIEAELTKCKFKPGNNSHNRIIATSCNPVLILWTSIK